jgi:hypothetical protein
VARGRRSSSSSIAPPLDQCVLTDKCCALHDNTRCPVCGSSSHSFIHDVCSASPAPGRRLVYRDEEEDDEEVTGNRNAGVVGHADASTQAEAALPLSSIPMRAEGAVAGQGISPMPVQQDSQHNQQVRTHPPTACDAIKGQKLL